MIRLIVLLLLFCRAMLAVGVPRGAEGQQISLADAKKMVASLDLSPKAQAKAERWFKSYEGRERKRQLDRYTEDGEDLKRALERILREMGILSEGATEITAGLEDGSLNVEDVRRDLTTIFRDLQRLRADAKALRKLDEDAWSEVTKDPDVWQSEQIARFPSLRNSLPILTPDVFDPTADD